MSRRGVTGVGAGLAIFGIVIGATVLYVMLSVLSNPNYVSNANGATFYPNVLLVAAFASVALLIVAVLWLVLNFTGKL
jgi:hypothetical protein